MLLLRQSRKDERMALDLSVLSKQVRQMTASVADATHELAERKQALLSRYLREAEAYDDWGRAADLSREGFAWLLARPLEPLNTQRDLPAVPRAYALVASDGSQIDVDRHGAVACYLLNMGCVYLRYGPGSGARLCSRPSLYYRDEDLYLSEGPRRVAIEGNYLSARRDVEEGVVLADLADEFLVGGELPSLALQDGTLVRWTLAGAERFVARHFLDRYLGAVERLRQRGIPLASYISRPRSPEVAGVMRLMLCPDLDLANGRGARCNECSDIARGRTASCMPCQGLTDADVLADTLAEGQRGPLFVSLSRVNVESYGPHLVCFFYIRVGREVGRVEIPQWVAADAAQVDLVHALVYDQCARGQGYPVALARAHEQAVVKAADRRAFLSMVEGSLLRADVPGTSSRKRENKSFQRG
jgi:hypothetical protein